MIIVNVLQLHRHHVRLHSFQKHAGVQPHQWETDSVLCQSYSGQNHDWLLYHRAEKGHFSSHTHWFTLQMMWCCELIVLSLALGLRLCRCCAKLHYRWQNTAELPQGRHHTLAENGRPRYRWDCFNQNEDLSLLFTFEGKENKLLGQQLWNITLEDTNGSIMQSINLLDKYIYKFKCNYEISWIIWYDACFKIIFIYFCIQILHHL